MTRQSLNIWLFTALVVSLYLPFFFGSLAISLFSLYCLFTTKFKRPQPGFIKRNLLPISYSAYFVMALISLIYTEDLDRGWGAISSMLAFVLLPWAIASRPSQTQKAMLVHAQKWFLIASFLIIVYFFTTFLVVNLTIGIIEDLIPYSFLSYFDLDPISVRVLSTDFMHAGYFSLYLGLALMIAVDKGLRSTNRRTKLWMLLMALALFLFIFLMQSRMVVIALFLMTLIFGLTVRRYRKIVIPVLVGMIVVAASIISFTHDDIAGRYLEIPTSNYDPTDKNINSVNVRLAMWNEVFSVIKEHPFLGVGIGDFRGKAIEAYENAGIVRAVKGQLDPHNQYLSSWLAMGIPGLLLLIWMLYLLIFPAYRNKSGIAYLSALFFTLSIFTESFLIRYWGIAIFCSLIFLQSFVAMRQKEEGAIKESKE